MTGRDEGQTPEQRRRRGNASSLAASFNARNSAQNFLLDLMMFFARLFNPDEESAVSPLLAGVLGFRNEDGTADMQGYRDWHRRQRDTDWERPLDGIDRGRVDYGRAAEIARNPPALPASTLSGELTARQQRVTAVMTDAAAAAGVSREYLVGLWGYESDFGNERRFGAQLRSPTGCQGDFQFTQATMRDVLRNHGSEIEARLRAQGLNQQADLVRNYRNVDINTLRNSPEISTYAAAFYSRDIARQLSLDPQQRSSWGMMYAGYNIGPGNARKIMSGQAATGWEVNVNSGVAGYGTAAQQARSYQRAMEQSADRGRSRFAFTDAASGTRPAAPAMADARTPADDQRSPDAARTGAPGNTPA